MRLKTTALIATALLTSLTHPARAASRCGGDCNDDGEVTINELIQAVTIALDAADLGTCVNADIFGDLQVTVDELVIAVANALNGCPPPAAPTPTASPSAVLVTPTPTIGGSDQVPPTNTQALQVWLQAGRYKGWAAESAPHVSGGPHGRTVRTFVNDAAFASLAAGNAAHPKGTALVKELFYNSTTVQGWAVEIKVEDDSAGGSGWYWYEGAGLAGRGLPVCTGCHGNDFLTYKSKDFVLSPFPLQ